MSTADEDHVIQQKAPEQLLNGPAWKIFSNAVSEIWVSVIMPRSGVT